MDLGRCLDLLELEECGSVEEARRAYMDLVRVWHPDRFSHDPRLRARAEEKLKRLNLAYETLLAHFTGPGGTTRPRVSGDSGVTPTEAFFEAGTRRVLCVVSSLTRAFRAALQ